MCSAADLGVGFPKLAAGVGGATQKRNRTGNFGSLYYLDAKGSLAVARVRTGITDGTTTEITGKNITEGMKVIAGTQTASATSTAASPFQSTSSQQQQRGARGAF